MNKNLKQNAIFRREWYEAVAELAQNVRYEIYQAAITYQLTGEQPEFKSAVAKAIFYFIKKQIDSELTNPEPATPGAAQQADGQSADSTNPQTSPGNYGNLAADNAAGYGALGSAAPYSAPYTGIDPFT